MTSAKYLDYDPATKTYRLPDEHAYLLASDDTDHFMGGLFPIVPVLLRLAPDVAIAFERGGGVPFEKFGRRKRPPPTPGCRGASSFVASTTGNLDPGEGFDLITACDCIHDFAAPQPPEGVFGLDVMNRGQYEHRLASYWLNAMPDVQARLAAGGRALDVGCGAGRIAVTLAKAFSQRQGCRPRSRPRIDPSSLFMVSSPH